MSGLTPVLDVLIVGGGPFGTAAAFRCKELGLNALVIDYDDLMKRIRDYAKDKLILPDFGGGDRMQFPIGGPLISKLHFSPIDKDQMCVEWKALYREHSVPAQVGLELTGLEREGDLWRAVTWNNSLKTEVVFTARHVVLAFGRGEPRRLEIPGDLRGLAFGLKDAAQFVGEPTCVIGGGTSAGEAVIAISNAKTAASDPSGIYWSYRGDKMPKVSKALAQVFFDAFMENGNIRYLPGSEPVSMFDVNGQPRLALRTARVESPGKPTEITQLEFSKDFCIACIGDDIPGQLMAAIGVPLVEGGPTNKKRPVVTPLLETRQPNVYLAGDVLSPAYFETADFASDPAAFAELKRRGNIKAAMRDGVLIAEVIAQKLAGKVKIDVQLEFADTPAEAPPEKAADSKAEVATRQIAVTKAALPVVPRAKDKDTCSLVSILPSGVEVNEFALKLDGATSIGGRGADIAFADDPTISEVQASVVAKDGHYFVQDDARKGNVFLHTQRPVELEDKVAILAGRQWLVAGSRKNPATIVHVDESGVRQANFEIREGATIVGRQSPDVSIAPDDTALSRRHLSLTLKSGKVTVKDLGSANGTQLRVSYPMRLVDGDRLLVGRQVLEFRDDRASQQPSAQVTFVTGPLPKAPPAPPPPPQPAVAQKQPAPQPVAKAPAAAPSPQPDGIGVLFDGLNKFAPCEKGKTICEAAEHAGIKLDADCHQGVCGMDPVKIIGGAENLNPIGGTERSTLEDLCSLEPGPYRLACMARVSGPVKVSIKKA